jgi:hypothetical protein
MEKSEALDFSFHGTLLNVFRALYVMYTQTRQGLSCVPASLRYVILVPIIH